MLGHRPTASATILGHAELDDSQRASAAAAMRDKLWENCEPLEVIRKSERTPWGPSSHRAIAASLLRLDPEPAAARAAHAYLLEHGRRHERWRAIEYLRAAPESVTGYERVLRTIIGDPAADPHLRRAAITNLSLLSELSAPTVAVLRGLTRDADPQLAARAKACLRAH